MEGYTSDIAAGNTCVKKRGVVERGGAWPSAAKCRGMINANNERAVVPETSRRSQPAVSLNW